MQAIEIEYIFSKIRAELEQLKSKRLNQLHMQDYNIDIIQKISTIENESLKNDSSKIDFINKNMHTSNNLNIVYYDKTVLSKWRLRRRAKKIFKLQQRIEKGYIAAVDASIHIVNKIYKECLEM